MSLTEVLLHRFPSWASPIWKTFALQNPTGCNLNVKTEINPFTTQNKTNKSSSKHQQQRLISSCTTQTNDLAWTYGGGTCFSDDDTNGTCRGRVVTDVISWRSKESILEMVHASLTLPDINNINININNDNDNDNDRKFNNALRLYLPCKLSCFGLNGTPLRSH